MTVSQFDNGYWYATELKEFANTIGIPSANKLRKDELEKAIKRHLKITGEANPYDRDWEVYFEERHGLQNGKQPESL